MNWILCPVKNNVALTKRALLSFQNQDIDVNILLIFNAADPDVLAWARTRHDFIATYLGSPTSVARAWNHGLNWILGSQNEKYCLVVNNDVELVPETYRLLLESAVPFPTAVSVDSEPKVGSELTSRPHPDFSCFLMRQSVWNKVHNFDEGFKIAYGEDCDYHCRLHIAGIEAHSLSIPFLHHGASSLKTANDAEKKIIQKQADKNREYFKDKWKFAIGSKEYSEFFEK